MANNKDEPISSSDAIFARAYADALKTAFGIDIGNHHCLLVSPVTQRGIPAGDLIYPQMTNYLIYKLADSLQYADNPSYTGGSAGSYLQQLRRYLSFAFRPQAYSPLPSYSYVEWIKTVIQDDFLRNLA